MTPLFKVFMSPSAPDAVSEVLQSGYIGQGALVDRFETELAKFFGHTVVTVNSCTSALDLAFHLCGVGPGDDVITTAQTCAATNTGIALRGATPVFVDVFPDSGLIDPESVRKEITDKTKAIVAVDWAGHPCDYNALKSFGIPVIEDAAHAVGSTYLGKHVAQTGGDYVCFSFQAIKHLTTGDGGAIKVPDAQLDLARRLRWFGIDRTTDTKFRFEEDIPVAGFKYHMNDIAAAIGLSNLPHLPGILTLHHNNAATLHSELQNVPHLHLPPLSMDSSWWLFTVRVRNPTHFITLMGRQGVTCSPVHARNDRYSAFSRVCRSAVDLRGLEAFSEHQVNIPVGWWLSNSELHGIIDAVKLCV